MKLSVRTLLVSVFFALPLMVSGCGGNEAASDGDQEEDGDTETLPEQEEEAADPLACPDQAGCFTLSYDLWGQVDGNNPARYNVLPFPYDYFTVATDTPTGLRVNLRAPEDKWSYEINTVLVDRALSIFDAKRSVKDINTHDGFSVNGNIMAVTGGQMDPESLPPEGQHGLNDTVVLLDIDPESAAYGLPVSFAPRVEEAYEFSDDDDGSTVHRYWYLVLRPSKPLASGGRYAVLLRRGLKDVNGRSPVPSAHFAQVWGLLPVDGISEGGDARTAERQRLSALKSTLEGIEGLSLEDVVLAFDFTTTTATRDNRCVVEQRFPAITITPPDMDWDGDDAPNFYALADYPSHLPSLPSVHRFVSDSVGFVAAGRLDIPEWRHYKDKATADTVGYYEFVRGEDHCPVQNGVNAIDFFLFYPKQPQQPMPVVMLQHGINSSKAAVGCLAGILAQHGIASFLMDFPFHGSREVGFAPLEFIDINYMLKAASSFKQAGLEQAYVLRAFGQGAFDLYPGGVGDGIPDFDPDRIGYAGQSLGSIVGEEGTALSPEVDVAYYNVGGMRLLDFVDGFLEDYGLTGIYPSYVVRQFGTLAQTVLDSGDPATFSPFIAEKSQGGAMQYLFAQAMEDETIPWQFSLNFALMVGPPQVRPVAFAIGGLPQVDAPYASGAGHYQYSGANHNFLFEGGDIGVKAREQFDEFFKSFVETGTAIIIDPYAK